MLQANNGFSFIWLQTIRKKQVMLPVNWPELQVESTEYGARLVKECRKDLSAVLPFSDAEREFLDLLLDHGEIDSTILTSDTTLQARIQNQPLLKWKAINVRQYRGLS